MKYVISGLAYFAILCAVQGIVSVIMGYKFIDGFNPFEAGIWRLLVRVAISGYLAYKYPIKLK